MKRSDLREGSGRARTGTRWRLRGAAVRGRGRLGRFTGSDPPTTVSGNETRFEADSTAVSGSNTGRWNGHETYNGTQTTTGQRSDGLTRPPFGSDGSRWQPRDRNPRMRGLGHGGIGMRGTARGRLARGRTATRGVAQTRPTPHRGGSRGGLATRGTIHRGRGGRTRGPGRGTRVLTGTGRGVNHHEVRGSRTEERRIGSVDVRMLQQLTDFDPGRIVNILHEYRVLLRVFLDGKSLSREETRLLLEVLGRACSDPTTHRSSRLKDILQLLDEALFLDEVLIQWVRVWSGESPAKEEVDTMVNAIVDLLTCMLDQIPGTINSIGVLAILLESSLNELKKKGFQMSPGLDSRLSAFSEEREERLREIRRFPAYGGRGWRGDSPVDDFRLQPILPSKDELKSDHRLFLRANIVNGNYKDVHHYLDVHFRLLREDFVQPLREGISEYTSELAENGPNSRKRIPDLNLYRNVKAIEVNLRPDGLSYTLRFEVERHLQKVDWDISKRLIHGALVCLSRDDFRTLLFGTVAERKPESLKHGIIEVAFEGDPNEMNELFSFPFIMTESPAYFEAYCHVLRCLQTLDHTKLPFAKYLVETGSGMINRPRYITDGLADSFDLSEIVEQTEAATNDTTSSSCLKNVNIGDDDSWPSAEMLGFDDSQMIAFQSALREEICLIQGPPGTGKTFIGLKVAKALLSNRGKWGRNRPMLVVCYTNHALDQFLEGILEFEKKIARIGSRSKCAALEQYNIKELRKTQTSPRYGICRGRIEKMAKEIGICKSFIDTAKSRLLKAEVLRCVMTEDQFESLGGGSGYSNKPEPIVTWLNILRESANYHEVQQEPHNDNSCGTEEIPGLSNDVLDDDDDFLDSVEPDMSEILRTVTPFFPVYKRLRNARGNRWTIVPDAARLVQIGQFVKTQLSQQNRMSKEEALEVRSVWRMNVQQRWRLYRRWVSDYLELKKRRRHSLYDEYNSEVATLKELRVAKDLQALKNRSVIGATTTGIAKYNELIRKIGAPIIIIEEAAEILEAHVITSLTSSTQHLILIGDHQQLRPNPAVYKLCRDFKLDVSLFERLINNKLPYHRLSLQHRMRPEVSNLLRVHADFYPALMDHKIVTSYKNVRGVEKDVFFVDHDIKELSDEGSRSRSNVHEASFLVSLYAYLLHQGYSSEQITILTAYRGQVRTLNGILKERKLEGVHVCPIDNFQGEENDIILFSFVRSNDEGSIGFLKVSNRVCVALSRAKMGLYCIGNFSLLSSQSELWKAITSHLQDKELFGPSLKLFCRNHPDRVLEAADSVDFRNAPEGGCKEPCVARLNCGHTCQRMCHPEDTEHRVTRCYKPCETVMCDLEHICPKLCFEECEDKCYVVVKKTLPCQHEQRDACFQPPTSIHCSHPCEQELWCGHQCKEVCGDGCTRLCQIFVVKNFESCDHSSTIRCHTMHGAVCPHPCERQLPCGHQCKEVCSAKCTQNCKKMVMKHFESCGHSSKVQCCKTRFASCPKPCERKLSCGHRCKGICGQECTATCKELVLKRFEPCGHSAKLPCDRHECPAPCATVLRCKHTCRGTCGDCQNGRYHLPCREVCKKVLLCGHTCGSLCMRSCPPCTKSCMVRCSHGSCPRRCWESCDPCKQPCTWECGHAKCSKPCEESCGRPPCNRNCPIPKKCKKRRHKCIGLCGERCPGLCRVCNKNEVAKALTEVKDKGNPRFIQLEDCSHIVEVKALDNLMAGSKEERSILKLPECPWCKTAITNASRRYQQRIRALRDDIDRAKKQVEPDGVRANMMKERLKERIAKAKETIQLSEPSQLPLTSFGSSLVQTDDHKWVEFLAKLDIELRKPRRLTSDLSCIDVLLGMYHKMRDLEEFIAEELNAIPSELISSTKQFDLLKNNREFLEERMELLRSISDQELDDWNREYRRCEHTVSLLHFVGMFKNAGTDMEDCEVERKLFDEIDLLLTDGCPFTDEKDSRVRSLLSELNSASPFPSKVNVAEKERRMLAKTAGFSRGDWYKCLNGHVYALADCRTSRNRCPECGI